VSHICLPGGASEATPPTRCIIPVCPAGSCGNILELTPDKLKVIRSSANSRRLLKNFSLSKYRSVVERLPEFPLDTDGYHSKCYKNFTAVSSKLPVTITNQNVSDERNIQLRRVTSPTSSTSTAGIFGDECLFCNKNIKRRPNGSKEKPGRIETKQAEKKIRDISTILKLQNVLVKISGVDLIAKEAKVHHSCRSEKIKAADRVSAMKEDIPTEKQVSKDVLELIYAYVEEHVIERKRPEHLKSIFDRYLDLCEEFELQNHITVNQYFGEVLKKRFAGQLIMNSSASKKYGVIVHSAAID